MENTKLNGYINIARKANALIIGVDNLKAYNKKMYLVVVGIDASDSTKDFALKTAQRLLCDSVIINERLEDITKISKCQIIGIKNKGLADSIKANII